ncbi:uncharacterized protein LOC144907988 isoform X2 [Branchiostoma floridae x Branchiostoma belcheri]
MEPGLGSLLPKRGQRGRRRSEGSIPLLYTVLPLATETEPYAAVGNGEEDLSPLSCFEMSTSGKKTSSEGTKDEKTKTKKSKTKKLLPFLRRRLSEGNLFVKSSSFPKFSAEEKKLQPENKDAAAWTAENGCSGGKLQTCAVSTQVTDPAGGAAVTSETQEKPTSKTSGTEPSVSSSSSEEARSQPPSKERSSGRKITPRRGESSDKMSSAKKGQSPSRGPSPKTVPSPKRSKSPSPKRAQSPSPKRAKSPSPKRAKSPSPKRAKSPSPKRAQSPSRKPSESRSQSPKNDHSPNNVTSPKGVQSSNGAPSPKRAHSPSRKQSSKSDQSPKREPSTKSGQSSSGESSPKRAPSPSRKPSEQRTQSPTSVPSPKREQSPSRKPSEIAHQSPNRVPSPKRTQSPSRKPSEKRGQFPNKGPSPKRGQSPNRCQSPKRGQSPNRGGPSPKRSQSPSRGPPLKRCQSPCRAPGSPKRAHSPRRSPSPKRSPSHKNNPTPKRGKSPDSSPSQSPNRKPSPKRSPSRSPPSSNRTQSPKRSPSPKRGSSPDRRTSPKRGQTTQKGPFPENARSRSPGSGSTSTEKTDASAVVTANLKRKDPKIDMPPLAQSNKQLLVSSCFSVDQGTSLAVVIEQPEMELEEACPDLPTKLTPDKDPQLQTVLDNEDKNQEEQAPSKAVENGCQVTDNFVEDVLPLQEESKTSSSTDDTVVSGSSEPCQPCTVNLLEESSERSIREQQPNTGNTEKTDEVSPTVRRTPETKVSSSTIKSVVEKAEKHSTDIKEETLFATTQQRSAESDHVTEPPEGPGCTPSHAATAATDNSARHVGSRNVEATCTAGQELRNTQEQKQQPAPNPQHTEAVLTSTNRIEKDPTVSAGLATKIRPETTRDKSTVEPTETAKQQVGVPPSEVRSNMDDSIGETTYRGDYVNYSSETSRTEVLSITENVVSAQEIVQGGEVLSDGQYSCDGPGPDNTPAAAHQQTQGIHHNKTVDSNIVQQTNGNSGDADCKSIVQEGGLDSHTAMGTQEVTNSNADITESQTVVDGNLENPFNNLAEEIGLAEAENDPKSSTESETVTLTDEHTTENYSTTRNSLEHSPLGNPDNGAPVKLPARAKKSSIPRRESTDSEKEDAGNNRKDGLSRHPPINGNGKRTNSKPTKTKVPTKTPSTAPGGGSKAGMPGKQQQSIPAGQRSAQEMARLPDSVGQNLTWPKQKKTTKEDKKEELSNFRRTSSLRLPTKEKTSFKRSVSFKLTERSESLSSLGSEASFGSKSDQTVSAAVAATRESVKKEWERRLHPHCPVPAPEPDKYLTPIQQKDFILRHLADLYKNVHKVISDRERQLAETEDDLRKLTEELSHREDDVIRMGTEAEMSASRVEDLTTEVRCLEAELAQHREAALSAQDEVSDEEYQRLEAQTELEEVRGQMEAAKRKASELQVAVDARETLCAELHRKLSQLQADVKKRDQETQRRFLEMYEKGRAAEQFEQSENLLYDAMSAPAQVNVNALLRRIKQLEEQLIQARGDQRSETYRKGEKAESDVQVKLRVLRDAVFYYLVEREREQNLQMILEICNYNDKQKKMIIKTLKQKD